MALINAFGDLHLDKHSPLGHAVSEIFQTFGDVVQTGRKSLFKFGEHANLGTTSTTINYLGIDPVRPSTNSITHFSSDDAADTQVLRVEGMTISGSDLTFSVQNITLNGQTKTALTTPLARVTRIANVQVGQTATLGDVYIYEDGAVTGGIPNDLTTVGNVMPADDQSTLFAGTSVASTNYFLATQWKAHVARKTAAFVDLRFQIAPVGGIFRTVQTSTAARENSVVISGNPAFIIPPNHDIRIVGTSSATNTDCHSSFDGYFADIQ